MKKNLYKKIKPQNIPQHVFIAKRQNMQLDFLESATLVDEIENAVRFIRCSVI